MSEVTVLVVSKKALTISGLPDEMTRAVEAAWQAHQPQPLRPACHPALLWTTQISELSIHVYTPRAALERLETSSFGSIRETIRPLWRRSTEQRGAFDLTPCGASILTAANRVLCERSAYLRLGVWRALAVGSGKPPDFSTHHRAHPADRLEQLRALHNQLHFLERVG